MLVSGSAWNAVTSVPVVEVDRPMRPLIGTGTRRESETPSQFRIAIFRDV